MLKIHHCRATQKTNQNAKNYVVHQFTIINKFLEIINFLTSLKIYVAS